MNDQNFSQEKKVDLRQTVVTEADADCSMPRKGRFVVGFMAILLISLLVYTYQLTKEVVRLQEIIAMQTASIPVPAMPVPPIPPNLGPISPIEIPEVVPQEPESSPVAVSKPVVVPADWKKFSATDNEYGFTTTLSVPADFSFDFTGSEFMLSNNTTFEHWDYSTSIMNGKNGIKNYYTGQSRRAWFQQYQNGDFMYERPSDYVPGKIVSVVEHPIGKSSYLEITVAGGWMISSGEKPEVNYVYVQNNIVHILKPVSEKAQSKSAVIPGIVDKIFTSLSSSTK
ncbi:hypothetical protein KA012_01930 [Candidatus Woesebacteria bacterium]|nr:hypothetical protein [Candidatus Woesebacteria bacterium]